MNTLAFFSSFDLTTFKYYMCFLNKFEEVHNNWRRERKKNKPKNGGINREGKHGKK